MATNATLWWLRNITQNDYYDFFKKKIVMMVKENHLYICINQ